MGLNSRNSIKPDLSLAAGVVVPRPRRLQGVFRVFASFSSPATSRFVTEPIPQQAGLDLHCLANGTVAGSVILLKDAERREDEIPKLLQSLYEDFLPDVDLEAGTLTYTVVMGEVLGNREATAT